jgi:hypothetical protein
MPIMLKTKLVQVVVSRKDNGFRTVCYTLPEDDAELFVKSLQGNITFEVKAVNALEVTTARRAMADLLDNA